MTRPLFWPAIRTARGADVVFISYTRLPKEAVTDGPLTIAPDLVVEVRSPSDRWTELLGKVSEYLTAGVSAVVILDPKTTSVVVYRSDDRPQVFDAADELVIPELLPGFCVRVGQLFE